MMDDSNVSWRPSQENSDDSNSSIASNREEELEETADMSVDADGNYIVKSSAVKVLSSSSRNTHKPNHSNEESDSSNDGRLTPMIEKAIRRSILNFSNATSDQEEDENMGGKGEIPESSDDSDFEISIQSSFSNMSHRKQNTALSYSSDEEPVSRRDKSVTSLTPKEILKQAKPKSSGSGTGKSRHRRILTVDDSSDEDDSNVENSNSDEDDSNKENSNSNKDDSNRENSNASNIADDSFENQEYITKSNDNSKADKSPNHSSFKKQTAFVDDSFNDKFVSSRDISNNSISEVESPSKGNVDSKESIIDDSLQEIENYDNGKKSTEMITLDSSDEKENEPNNSLETSVALSFAKEEIKNTGFDPLLAQKRAHLVCKMQQLQTQLAKMKMLFGSANLSTLPDNGERLKHSIVLYENELKAVTEELNAIQLDQTTLNTSSDVKPLPSLFKQGSLEIDPTFSKPLVDDHKELGKKAQDTVDRELALTVERLQDLHGSLLARPAENERAKDPRGLKIPLMPHQQHALAWLLWREHQKPRGGVLADDMGLGKTLTMISLIMASIAKNNSGDGSDSEDEWQSSARPQKHMGGTLVVAPASLLAQWAAEVKNRCKRGILSVELYHGNNRETVPKRLAKNDIVVTTYNILSRENKLNGILFKIYWRRVILDEAHVVRNHKSQACEAVCALSAKKRWAITGTPIHNKEMDLYAILKFLKCSPFDDVRVWKRWVDNKNAAGHQRLATVMKTLMLRRTKQELMAKGDVDTLPEKSTEVVEVTLDPEERLIYDKVMVFSRTIFAQFLSQRAEKQHMFELGAGKYDKPVWETNYRKTQFTKAQNKLLAMHADVEAHQILVLLLRLRQVCCHPALIHSMLDREDIETNVVDGTMPDSELLSQMNKMKLETPEQGDEPEGDVGVDERISEHLLTSDNPVFDNNRQSSKMRAVLAKIEEIVAKDDKVIVVSQWVGVLNVVADQLSSISGASYRMFTGQVAVKDRQGIMDAFNDPHSEPNILLLSLTAGGVGLNLVGANHLLLIDIHWNPQLESQAQDRIYRFGQTKNVYVYKYICTDTIEERIKALQERKLELAQAVLVGGGNVVGSKLTIDDLKSLFGM